jgi:tetratricopeptide (TPR) repeat protein
MKLATQLAPKAQALKGLTLIEQAQHCCSVAQQLERAGEYEAAREMLGAFWPERTGKPVLEELDLQSTGEVSLRVGALIGWLGRANQSQRQESAKDLITRSIEIFTELGEPGRVAEAQSDLALCYWREGGFDEARINLDEALQRVRDDNGDLKAMILIRAAEVERSACCFNDALRFLEMCALLANESKNPG